MRKLSIIMMLGAVLLAGCGGDASSIYNEGAVSGSSSTGSTGSSGSTGTTSPSVATLVVTTSSPTIAADGSTTATITATAENSSNNLVSGVTVTFAASAGGLAVTQATTSATGVATATLQAGTAAAGTVITVTASTGSVSGKVTVTVGTIQQTVTVVTSAPQIPSAGNTSATLTAYVLNAQNQFVPGVAVNFSATCVPATVVPCAGLNVTQGTTGTNGAATATLSAAGSPENRAITVTATAGTSTATVPVDVIGTTLSASGPTSLIQGAQGTYTVTLNNSAGTGIANQTVTLSSAKGNTLNSTSVTTGANGQATFTVTAAVAGADTITVKALGLQATAALSVSNEAFSFSAPTAAQDVAIQISTPVTIAWTAGGVAQTGQVVSLTATRGTLSANTVTIGASGTAAATITSSTAGPSVITATGTGVSAQVAIEFVATDANALNLQASPATIDPQGQSTLTATVTDPNGNLVEGKVVNFTLTDITGGSLSVASATTDAQGQATTVYTASSTTSALNGVQVQATVAGTGVTGSTTLTVAGATVFLSLGTGNTISAYSSTQYEMPFTVQAVDAAGNGVNNIVVSFTVQSVAFVQGVSVYNTTVGEWQRDPTTLPTDRDAYEGTAACKPGSEIINGVVTLVPGSIASTDVASATTGTAGTAAVNLIYPKDHWGWVVVELTATATVSGTQSSTSSTFYLPALSSDLTSQTVDPPGILDPYGDQTTCLVPN